jgi:hypothetical protein
LCREDGSIALWIEPKDLPAIEVVEARTIYGTVVLGIHRVRAAGCEGLFTSSSTSLRRSHDRAKGFGVTPRVAQLSPREGPEERLGHQHDETFVAEDM